MRPLFSSLAACWASIATAAPQQPQPPATVTLSGRVLAATGTPVAGAAVAWAPAEGLTTAGLLAAPPLLTAADGRFAVTVAAREDATADDWALPRLWIAKAGFAAVAPRLDWRYADRNAPPPRARLSLDLGDVVLPPGVRLVGRVRDRDGNAVVGALVVATDLLDDRGLLGGPAWNCCCRATSDSNGIFQLPATLPNALQLEVRAAGFLRQQQQPVSASTPLEFELTLGGAIAGRLLDHEGRGIAGATVVAEYERRGPTTTGRTAPDGSFSLPREHAGRYRLRATANGEDERKLDRSTRSRVLDGPVANLELTMPAAPESAPIERLRVRAITAATGEPVGGVQVLALWNDIVQRYPQYRDQLFRTTVPRQVPAVGNEVEVVGPESNETKVGCLLAIAPGFAPTLQSDVAWTEIGPGETREPVLLRMAREATIAGRVVDASGAPVAGASVWAVRILDPTVARDEGPPDGSPRSGADGTFVLRQLGEGRWQVRARLPDRPGSPPTSLELAAEQQATAVVLVLPPGARVAGRIVGAPLAPAARVLLQPLPGRRSEPARMSTFPSPITSLDDAVPLADDGSFAFDGVSLDTFMLVLLLPSPPRLGSPLALPIEPMRVRAAGVRRDFDASDDAPGRIVGTVQFPHADLPLDRLVVVAQQIDGHMRQLQQLRTVQGQRAFVGSDRRFAIAVAPGSYRLIAIDLTTRLVLACCADQVTVAPAATATADLTLPLAAVDLQLAAEETGTPRALVDHIEVRVLAQGDSGPAKLLGNDTYDQGTGIPVPSGVDSVRLLLPLGKAALFARSDANRLRDDDRRGNDTPLGREEFDLEAGPAKVVVMKIAPPPELDDEAREARGDGRGRR